jgi:dephospho-CoA kinase
MPDAEKRARADFVITTAFGFAFTRAHVRSILEVLTNQPEAQE